MRKLAIIFGLLLSAQASAALHDLVTKGSTDRSVTVDIIDATDGTPETGVVFNTSGIDLWYRRDGGARVAITEATLAALTTAHADGGFLHVSDGTYRLDLPDAAFATGANYVDFGGTVTGMVVIGGRVRLTDFTLETATQNVNVSTITDGAIAAADFAVGAIDGSAIANDAITAAKIASNAIGVSEIAGGAITSGKFAAGAITAAVIATDAIGAAQVAPDVSTEFLSGLAGLAVNSTQISGDSGAADALEVAFDGTAGAVAPMGIVRQGTAQSATATALVLDAAAAFADDTAIGMTLVACGSTQGYCQSRAVTDNVLSTDTFTVETWTVTPSGTITFYLFGTAPGASGGGLDAAGVRAAVGLASANLDTQFSGIQSDTDNLQTRVPAALVSGRMDSSTGAMAANVLTSGAINDGAFAAAEFATDFLTAAKVAADVGTEFATALQTQALNAGTANSVGERLGRIPNVAAGGNGGLPTVNASNQIAGIAGTIATLDALDTAQDAQHSTTQGLVSTADAVADAIKLTTDKLDTAMELDGAVYRFTANALEQAPTGTGESLEAIADAVWDEALSGHATAGSTGEALSSASAGGGLDAAGVRAAVGLASANLDTQLTAIDDYVDTEIAALTTAVADIPTNAELATSQAAADDATLAAIAALNNLSAANIRDLVIEDQGGGVSLGCAIAVVLAYAAGDLTTTGGDSTYEDPSGTETRATGTVSSSGNRAAAISCPTY